MGVRGGEKIADVRLKEEASERRVVGNLAASAAAWLAMWSARCASAEEDSAWLRRCDKASSALVPNGFW